jgi:hypothetical protein
MTTKREIIRARRDASTDAKNLEGDGAHLHNVSKHAGRRGGPILEASATKPSRKSTRKSVDHTRAAVNLQLRAQRETASPQAQAARGTAKTKK